jgi:hypothetical protein
MGQLAAARIREGGQAQPVFIGGFAPDPGAWPFWLLMSGIDGGREQRTEEF